jgi:phenylpyruvate tautomerase PptA (4-oxalocrotonate tautomerase family)
MPLVRIDLVQGKSAEYRRAIGGVVYEAMVDVLKAPKDDRFQVIAEYPADALIADENYLGIRRTQDCVFIQLALNIGRSVEQKRHFTRPSLIPSMCD